MDNPAVSGPPDDPRVPGPAESPAPAMPLIQQHEKSPASPYLLTDAPRMIGWQWSPPAKGGPQFVIATRSPLGGIRVGERFPLTEQGWAGAWRSLAQHPAAAQKAAAVLAARAAPGAAPSAQRPADTLTVFSSLTRRNRVIITGMLAGLIVSISGDLLLVAAQRCLNWLVLHGFAGGINAEWTGDGGPISIMTSPVTLLLLAVAAVIAGLGAGIFAAALIGDKPTHGGGHNAQAAAHEAAAAAATTD